MKHLLIALLTLVSLGGLTANANEPSLQDLTDITGTPLNGADNWQVSDYYQSATGLEWVWLEAEGQTAYLIYPGANQSQLRLGPNGEMIKSLANRITLIIQASASRVFTVDRFGGAIVASGSGIYLSYEPGVNSAIDANFYDVESARRIQIGGHYNATLETTGHIDQIIASGATDELYAPNLDSNWQLFMGQKGLLQGAGWSTTIAFEGMGSLFGSDFDDTFLLADATIDVNIDGAGGNNNIILDENLVNQENTDSSNDTPCSHSVILSTNNLWVPPLLTPEQNDSDKNDPCVQTNDKVSGAIVSRNQNDPPQITPGLNTSSGGKKSKGGNIPWSIIFVCLGLGLSRRASKKPVVQA